MALKMLCLPEGSSAIGPTAGKSTLHNSDTLSLSRRLVMTVKVTDQEIELEESPHAFGKIPRIGWDKVELGHVVKRH